MTRLLLAALATVLALLSPVGLILLFGDSPPAPQAMIFAAPSSDPTVVPLTVPASDSAALMPRGVGAVEAVEATPEEAVTADVAVLRRQTEVQTARVELALHKIEAMAPQAHSRSTTQAHP